MNGMTEHVGDEWVGVVMRMKGYDDIRELGCREKKGKKRA